MSEENVDLVRRAYDAWNERGPESIEQFWAEDAEFHDPPSFPIRGWCGVGMRSLPIRPDQVRVLGT